MATIYRIYGANHKWICGSAFFDPTDSFSKEEAAARLKGEPERCVVDVYDFTTCPLKGYEVVCRAVLWRYGEDGVLASDVLPEEKEALLFGRASSHIESHLSSARGNSILIRELSVYAPNWREQISNLLKASDWNARIWCRDGDVYAEVGRYKVRIQPAC